MSLAQIRNRVNALRRQFALPLAVLRLRRLVEKLCLDWSVAIANRQPLPDTHIMASQLAGRGPKLPTYHHLHRHLENCRARQTQPDPYNIIRSLIPWISAETLNALFQCDLGSQVA